MNRTRWITVGLAAALTVLVVAVVAVAIARDPNTSATIPSQTATGPFLTASSIPGALTKRPIPSFDLSDARGGRFFSRSLHGRPYVITFLYVHCVDVCPLIGSEIHQALADLGASARRMSVVAISVDPHGDTRNAVRRWLKLHQEPSNFHYLIGSQHELMPIWKAFFVSPQIPGDPHSSHTAIIWLVNRRGHLAALIPAGLPLNTANLAHDLAALQSQ